MIFKFSFSRAGDAAWVIGHTTDDDGGDRIEAVIEAACVPSLIRLSNRKESDVAFPALRGIRGIVSGNDAQVDAVLEAGILKHMKKLLTDSSSKITESAGFTVSNITAGSAQHVQAVIDAGVFEDIRNVLAHGKICAKKEAAYAVANISGSGTTEQILFLCQRVGILQPFCDLIRLNNEELDLIVKDGLYGFLKTAGSDILTISTDENCASNLSDQIQILKLDWYEPKTIFNVSFSLSCVNLGTRERNKISTGKPGDRI